MIIQIDASNPAGMSALLVNLHPQLDNDDLIVVKSDSAEVAKIVRQYSSSRCVTIFDRDADVQKLCITNKMDGVLALDDRITVSMTLVNNLKRASRMTNHDCLLIPVCKAYTTKMNPNFSYYNKSTQAQDIKDTTFAHEYIYPYAKVEKIGNVETVGLLTNELIYRRFS